MSFIRFCAFLSALAIAARANAQFAVDGSSGGSEPYVSTANNANANFSMGTSSKSETMLLGVDGSDLYVFIEGSLNNTNYCLVLFDSDANNATGFATHPNGATAASNGLEYFTAFPDGGGYDLLVAFRAGGGSSPTTFEATLISYDAAGAIIDEVSTGSSASNPGSLNATIRGLSGSLAGAMTAGDGPGDGVEFSIPRSWLANSAGVGSIRAMCVNANGTVSEFSDSCIPMMGATGTINVSVPGDEGRLTGLTAPVWVWSALPVEVSGFDLE